MADTVYVGDTWVWNTVGTTTTGITFAPTSVRFTQTTTGNAVLFNDWVDRFTGASAEATRLRRAVETPEVRETRERRQLLHYLSCAARSVGTDEFDMDRCLHWARNAWPTLVPSVEHQLPYVLEHHTREIEDTWQRRREEQIARQREAAVVAGKKEAADHKAELLLQSVLSAEQKREWLEHRWVTEVAPSGRRWRLRPLWSGGAEILADAGHARATICVHAREAVPIKDNMVMLLMTIRGDENRLIRVGILHGGRWNDEELAIRATRQRDVDAAAA